MRSDVARRLVVLRGGAEIESAQFATSALAKTGTASTQIVPSKIVKSDTLGPQFDRVSDDVLRQLPPLDVFLRIGRSCFPLLIRAANIPSR